MATPIFNSPLPKSECTICGFAAGATHRYICSYLLQKTTKGAAHRNILCKEIEKIVTKTLHIEMQSVIVLHLYIID
ncbi:MAG TPA: hypothetical protein VJ602_04965 [Paludibacter sp.]|nr:hypothetical protein [Paludibacter sp.]